MLAQALVIGGTMIRMAGRCDQVQPMAVGTALGGTFEAAQKEVGEQRLLTARRARHVD